MDKALDQLYGSNTTDTSIPNVMLKEVANIGKRFIKKIMGMNEVLRRISVELVPANQLPDHHLSCQFRGLGNRGKKLCYEHCTNDIRTVERVVYVDEDEREIPPLLVKGLSKLQMKQLLLYHFLGVDSKGFIKHLQVTGIAKMLNCHARSVRANNRVFEMAGLAGISYASLSSDKEYFSVVLKDYTKGYLSKDEGGEGFLRMARKTLMELVSIESINVLRVELEKLVRFDNDTIKRKMKKAANDFSVLTYESIKAALPPYARFKSFIEKLLQKGTKAFEQTVEGLSVMFKLKEDYDGKIVRKRLIEEAQQGISSLLGTYRIDIVKDDLQDLVQLSLEYSLPVVLKAIESANFTYKMGTYDEGRIERVRNFGGLIREIIRSSYFKIKAA